MSTCIVSPGTSQQLMGLQKTITMCSSRLLFVVHKTLASGSPGNSNLFKFKRAPDTHARLLPHATGEDRVSDFEVKLMDIDSEHLGIPDTDYAATIHMPASEYQRICRDLSSIGDTGRGVCCVGGWVGGVCGQHFMPLEPRYTLPAWPIMHQLSFHPAGGCAGGAWVPMTVWPGLLTARLACVFASCVCVCSLDHRHQGRCQVQHQRRRGHSQHHSAAKQHSRQGAAADVCWGL